MTAPRTEPTITVDEITRKLRLSRRADVAAGVLLGVLQLAELVDIDPYHRRVISIAMRDAAHAIHREADTVFAELVHAPDGEWVDEDELACPTCDGEPADRITALADELNAAHERNAKLVAEVVTRARALAELKPGTDEPAAGTLPEEVTP